MDQCLGMKIIPSKLNSDTLVDDLSMKVLLFERFCLYGICICVSVEDGMVMRCV